MAGVGEKIEQGPPLEKRREPFACKGSRGKGAGHRPKNQPSWQKPLSKGVPYKRKN